MVYPDTEHLVRQAMATGYQWSSLLIPPVYVAYVLARRGRVALSINRVLRATWVGGLSGKSAYMLIIVNSSKFEPYLQGLLRQAV